jgi:hypothetical protein
MVTSSFEGHLIDLLEVEGSLTDTPMLCADSPAGPGTGIGNLPMDSP